MAQNSPKSFLSGSNISFSNVLKDYNKNEFHHIYPKAFMGKIDSENKKYDVNCLANFCMLSRADNKKIDCLSPSEYRKNLMPKDANKIFSSNFISESALIEDDFNKFIQDRAEQLRAYTTNLINIL